ncbi:MAG: DUF6807 family protein [Planctomycetota bacterium]|jgi:hypothetical protein
MKRPRLTKEATMLAVVWVLVLQGGCQKKEPITPVTQPSEVAFEHQPNKLNITIGGKPFATYVYEDSNTPRPYFAHVNTPSGIQATRNHPPVQGIDALDHPTFHPGIWLAFGDISRHDYWRLKAKVEHEMFVEKPKGGLGKGTFTVRNYYLTTDGKDRVCAELCRYSVLVRPAGYLLVYESKFSSDAGDFVFGEQDEMGLGLRVNTKISVELGNGHITNAEGLKDEDQVRGPQSDWCDYSGVIDGTRVGMMIMPDTRNFRRCWWHARDFGFMAGNFFGHDGGKNPTTVKKGEKFHLGYGVLIYSAPADSKVDLNAAYLDYLLQIGADK